MPLQLDKRIVVLVQVLRKLVKVSDVGRKGVRLCGATRSRDKRRRLAQLWGFWLWSSLSMHRHSRHIEQYPWGNGACIASAYQLLASQCHDSWVMLDAGNVHNIECDIICHDISINNNMYFSPLAQHVDILLCYPILFCPLLFPNSRCWTIMIFLAPQDLWRPFYSYFLQLYYLYEVKVPALCILRPPAYHILGAFIHR